MTDAQELGKLCVSKGKSLPQELVVVPRVVAEAYLRELPVIAYLQEMFGTAADANATAYRQCLEVICK